MKLKFWQKAPAHVRPDGPYFKKPAIVSEATQKREDLERLLALANIPDHHPVWKTLLSYADEHARNEQESALGPGLPDSVRQYNAGRAAGALDFAIALRELRAEANLAAKRMEKKTDK